MKLNPIIGVGLIALLPLTACNFGKDPNLNHENISSSTSSSEVVLDEDSIQNLLKRYEESNHNIEEFKGYQIVNLAHYFYEQTPNHHSCLEGLALAKSLMIKVKQTVRTTNIRRGNLLFWESISESTFAKPAYRAYASFDNDEIIEYKGKVDEHNNGMTATWSEEYKNSYNEGQFKQRWGRTLKQSNIYDLTKESVLNPDEEIAVRNDNLIITLNLDPVEANKRYSTQIITMANADNPPVFNNLTLTYIIDKNLKLVQREINENYDVKVGLSANTTDSFFESYFYDDKLDIPDLNTDLPYHEL